jgi:hypothetical protein
LEIRVLTLLPGQKEAPVVCEVDHTRADRISKGSEDGYSALSYTLGSPDETGVLYLQGLAIQVRQNLLQVSQIILISESHYSQINMALFVLFTPSPFTQT